MKKILVAILVGVLVLGTSGVVLAKNKKVKKAKIWTTKKLTTVTKKIQKDIKGIRHIVSNLEEKINLLEKNVTDLQKEQRVTKVVAGEIDFSKEPDATSDCNDVLGNSYTCKWRAISVPALDLSKSPQVQVLIKRKNTAKVILARPIIPNVELWNISGDYLDSNILIAQEKVYVVYKAGETELIEPEYKIIVTSQK